MIKLRHLLFLLACGVPAVFVPPAQADDIDIFVGTSGGAASAPNIMFLLDNSSNWSAASQHWPDAPTQGDAELQSIGQALPGIARPANVGLAMFTAAGPYGGYIRFGARDISNSTNVTALQNIVGGINVNSSSEKIDVAKKDDSAGLYELYKYFSGLAPYAGAPANNPNADFAGNTQSLTGAGQGLTSGFAFKSDGTYNSPSTGCSKGYIIFIANNGSGNGTINPGQSSYESGVDVAPLKLPAASKDLWSDEWAKYLYQNKNIVTYVIDVYNANQKNVNYDASYSAALQSVAKQGGGTYYQASSKAQIQADIQLILDQIQAVSSSFAAANLPVSATSRTQNLNKVFIGMFQPDPNAKPRWFGNLKQYQLILSNGAIALGDFTSPTPIAAVNPLSGFMTSCAISAWTFDTSSYQPTSGSTAAPYWSIVPTSPPSGGTCPNTTAYSDLPDGPLVQKGAVAEILRSGNNPSGTLTWNVSRTIKTYSSGSLVDFSTSSSGLLPSLVNFIEGYDVNDENGNGLTDGTNGKVPETRPSIHGDVIHSQPLTVNYASNGGIVVYYGANDGMLHAVDGNTGQERWAFIAPEFFPRFNRLMTDSPIINYWGTPPGVTPTPLPKDYFFDGSIGLYENKDNTQVWLYPTMRRGGRMLYGFDVSAPGSLPSPLWRVGCPDLADDNGCTSSGMSGIGQTWSTPRAAFIKGYSTTNPVVVVGGGYDSCEDAPSASPSCPAEKGAGVYILDAANGSLLTTSGTAPGPLTTDRSVAGDISLVDMNFDGYVDYAYVADTGGNLYRISFVDGPTTLNPVDPAHWTITKIAYTHGAGRKFLFGPAVMPNNGQVYLAIGSGDREHPLQAQYPYTTPVTNRFYVYLDNPATTVANNLDDTTATIMTNCTTASDCSSVKIVPGGTLQGWYMDLTAYGTGEQTVSGALIAGGMAAFGTNRPIPQAVGTCTTVLGEARGYWVSLLNGVGGIVNHVRSEVFVGGGFPNTPQLSTVQIGNSVYTVVGGAASLDGGASSTIQFQRLTPPISSKRKRVYWYTPVDN